jgi:excisionase family DNA binding protein
MKPAMPDAQRLTLSVREAAKSIGISTTTLYRLFDEKKLP